MYYVYVIESEKDKELYIGSSDDLKKSLRDHNRGRHDETRRGAPFKMLYYESFHRRENAAVRESDMRVFWHSVPRGKSCCES